MRIADLAGEVVEVAEAGEGEQHRQQGAGEAAGHLGRARLQRLGGAGSRESDAGDHQHDDGGELQYREDVLHLGAEADAEEVEPRDEDERADGEWLDQAGRKTEHRRVA